MLNDDHEAFGLPHTFGNGINIRDDSIGLESRVLTVAKTFLDVDYE